MAANLSALDDDEIVDLGRSALTALIGRLEDDEQAQALAWESLNKLNEAERTAWKVD